MVVGFSLLQGSEAKGEGESEKGEQGQPAHAAHVPVPLVESTFPSFYLLNSEMSLHVSSGFESQKQVLAPCGGDLVLGGVGPRSQVCLHPSGFTSVPSSTLHSHLPEGLEA